MTEMMTIGNRIKGYRKQSGFSQESLARFLGVDQTLISRVESGERALGVESLEKLAALFGVELSAFEQADAPAPSMTFAFRANDLSNEDMEVLCAIHRIALNAQMLAKLLDGGDVRG